MFHVGKCGPFDYVSVTPPYTEVDYGTLLAQLENSLLIGENCFIVSCTKDFAVEIFTLCHYH